MFELEIPTKAKQTDLEVLSQKNRPADSNPGVVLSFMAERPNSALSELSGLLRSSMYCKDANAETTQKTLEGVEPISDLPNLTPIGEHIGRFTWAYKQTGCTLIYDYGTGGSSNIELKDVTVEALHITCKEGGTTTWQWKCEINDVDVAVFGKLATFKNREVSIQLIGPRVEDDLISSSTSSSGTESSSDSTPAAGQQADGAQGGDGKGPWPFPNDAPSEAPKAAASRRKGGKTAEEIFANTSKA